ncbi:flagellar basal body rod protein [Paenalkalicoccus suaedae]|uniref:Flagellar basal body rod protein n=1 Tax=Paenalkalicoccus suaedae TaxID=2592382 RepID=A0A859FFD1_9BACI|nr:flagellar basal body rod protein [Paenalkalicoccus suaedae]QKS71869.1 flagellar basal body rod protein [Paenalkalicoccus suaedae]
MKKFLLIVLAVIAALTVIANLIPMILLAIGGYLLYVCIKQFKRTTSTGAKVMWTIFAVLVASVIISNIYAVIGVAALYFLYVMVRSWKTDGAIDVPKNVNPFEDFDREWSKLAKK